MSRTDEQFQTIARLRKAIERVDVNGTVSDDAVLIADQSLMPLPGTNADEQLRVGDLRNLLALVNKES